ncbi:hypothetical protein AHF37_06974 [Paragonimus kellicotti]|nr:hypothetical protein AHF37_06974 [Paragonimus kellicotti]
MDSSKITIAGIKILEFVSQYWKELQERRYPVLPDFSKITPGYLQRILPPMAPELPEELITFCKIFTNRFSQELHTGNTRISMATSRQHVLIQLSWES